VAKKIFKVGNGVQVDKSLEIIHGVEVPGTTGGLEADNAQPGSIFVDDTTGILYKKLVAGIGTNTWSIIASEKAPTSATGITAVGSVLDEVLVDKATSMRWNVDIEDGANNSIRTTFVLTATHDGTAIADAVATNWSIYDIVDINGGVPVWDAKSQLTGTGANQIMQLVVMG